VDAVCRDFRSAPISEKEKALFAYIERLTLDPGSMSQEHADALHAVGWTDAEIFDAVSVCALFSFFNRWIDGNGVPDVPPGWYDARVKGMGDFKYG
jgi:uncharacterized peroxidase-related enzyme